MEQLDREQSRARYRHRLAIRRLFDEAIAVLTHIDTHVETLFPDEIEEFDLAIRQVNTLYASISEKIAARRGAAA